MTTVTKIRPQTVTAAVPEDVDLIPTFQTGQTASPSSEEIRYWRAYVTAWQRALVSPRPNPFRLLINSEWHAEPQRTSARAAQLRELAIWSVTKADLDWDHLRDIDRIGWGT